MTEPIPIREISRLTGVNTVTLRAWERRYGLLKPLRTNKGHRLYRQEDVELVKKIQAWLARGLAISKVSELLENGQQENPVEIENVWIDYFKELSMLVAELDPAKFEAFLNQLFALYPAEIITDQLISPLLDNLSVPVFGNCIKKSIFVNRINEYLLMLIQRQRQQANGKRIAIIQLVGEANPLITTLLHYGLTTNQYRCDVVGSIPVEEVILAKEQLQLDAITIYADSVTSLSEFQRQLSWLAQKISIPIIVGGKLSPSVSAALINPLKHLHFVAGRGQQEFISTINCLLEKEAIKADEVINQKRHEQMESSK
jgi:DNA-binding transcriptional MerR regulator